MGIHSISSKFNQRIVAFCLIFACMAQILTVVVTLGASKRDLLQRADVELATGAQVVAALMGSRSEQEAGLRVDDEMAQAFGYLTGFEVSYFLERPGDVPFLAGSTLRGLQRASLAEQATGLWQTRRSTVRLDSVDFVGLAVPFTASSMGGRVVLQRLMSDILAPYRRLRTTVLWITAIVLSGSLAAAVFVVRQVTQPLTALTNAAQELVLLMDRHPSRIHEDDDEIGQLTGLFHRIAHKAQHDSLTGLPNRLLALGRLAQYMERSTRSGQPLVILFMDLNGFKTINDRFGHELGDRVLRKTARRLSEVVRSVDTVARLGGDEFLIILDNVDAHQALSLATSYTEVVAQPIASDFGPLLVGTSIGIAQYPQHGSTARQLLRAADAAMYSAKKTRGGAVIASGPVAESEYAPDSTQSLMTQEVYLKTWEGTERSLRSLQGAASKMASR